MTALQQLAALKIGNSYSGLYPNATESMPETDKARIDELIELGLLAKKIEYGEFYYRSNTIAPDVDDLASEICNPNGATSGDIMLLAWLLLNGGKPEYYGGIKITLEQVHILLCGPVYTNPVDNDTWYSFSGTFATSDDRRVGLVSLVTCQCGLERATWHAEADNMLSLIRQLLR